MDTHENLSVLAKQFSDEDEARAYLERLRWSDGVPTCPHCNGREAYCIHPKPGSKTRKGLWKCKACKKQYTVTVGTIFEDSHIPLSKWLLAIHLLCASKKGMSAHQLHRMLGITYKSAWFMAHRIRWAMTQTPLVEKLKGVVEVDETWVGGKEHGTSGIKRKKTPVVALVQRDGEVRPFTVERVTAKNLRRVMREQIHESSTVMTDEFRAYKPFVRGDFAAHHAVNHSKKEYARGDVHVNRAENFFSIVKRGIGGVYQHVSRHHLPRYLNEFSFRYNSRKVDDGVRAIAAVKRTEGKRLSYRPLVQKESGA